MVRSVMMVLVALVGLAGYGMACADEATQRYELDPAHTQVRFSYDHFGFSMIEGRFDGVEGSVVWNEKRPELGSVEVRIP